MGRGNRGDPMTGHCEHCHPRCSELSGAATRHVNTPTLHVTQWKWLTGHCPMCAERKRIAAEIEALNEYDSDHWEWEPCLAIDAAARIARGDA